MTESSSFEQQLQALRDTYQQRIPEDLNRLRQLAERLTGTASDEEILRDQLSEVHKIAGSAGSFGLHELSEQARRTEYQLESWLSESAYGEAREMMPGLIPLMERCIAAPSPGRDAGVAHADRSPIAGDLAWLRTRDEDMAQLPDQLRAFGYSVYEFDSVQALASTSGNRPFIVLADLDDIGIYEDSTINDDLARHYFIGISNQDDFEIRKTVVARGIQDFVPKPLDSASMARRIERVLQRYNAPPGRVLVVEDDTLLARFYRSTLEAAGMDVRLLPELSDIMNQLADFHPDLVLMDLHMPGVSGSELARIIRLYDRWSTLPIVFLSAETDIGQRVEAVASTDADDFMIKPVPPTVLVSSLRSRIARARQLTELMLTDSLTGLMTHARIKDALQAELSRSRRQNRPVSVAMFDLDHFKQVNDTYGHAAGDKVIVGIAALVRHAFRHGDIKGRYGGEEFVVVFPDTGPEDALQLIERLRERFASLSFTHEGQTFQCTLSAGVAASDELTTWESDQLLEHADRALYAAKEQGRNRVRLAR